jgi:hypothetical protein
MRLEHLAHAGWAGLATGDADAETLLTQARAPSGAFLDRASASRTEVLAREWQGDPEGLDETGVRIEEEIFPHSPFWGAWGRYARALAALISARYEAALEAAVLAGQDAVAVGERRLRWRVERVAWRALEALGRTDEALDHRNGALEIVRDFAANSSAPLRERFLARPDVAELVS